MQSSDNIPCLVRVGRKFVNEENIRAIKRDGANTRIQFMHGDDLLVELDYNKVKALFPRVK